MTETPMTSELARFVWLSEPTLADSTPARRDESTLGWLARSTHLRAQAAREFLRFNLAQLPASWRARLCCELETRWDSAMFELVVARTLQALGAELEVEQPTASGSRPDFLARFATGTAIVEATTPKFRQLDTATLRRNVPLEKIIEELAPPGWTIAVEELPDIGPADSKREFRSGRWASRVRPSRASTFTLASRVIPRQSLRC